MKKLPTAMFVALLMTGCESPDRPQGRYEEETFSASLMVKCEACGKGVSKQAKDCTACGHPNPIFATAVQRRSEEATRLVHMEQKRLEEAKAKRLVEMEAAALAEMKAQGLAEEEQKRQGKAANDEHKQKPAATLLELEVRGGEKPTQVLIGHHPRASFNGTYQAQAKLVNGRMCYKNENDMYLYFYDQAEGGEKGWSLDHRKPDGKKDHYSGGWYYLESFSHLNSKCDAWLDVH